MHPIIGTVIGDPCGIGPEIVVKAIAGDTSPVRHLLIGDAGVVEGAIRLTGASLTVRAIARADEARFDRACIDVLDPGDLDPGAVTPGRVSAACGKAVAAWREIAAGLARDKWIDAIVQAPINSEAIRLGTGSPPRSLAEGTTHLMLITGPLRVIHLTDHIPMRAMLDQVRMQNVLDLIRLTHASLVQWGIGNPRIGVAGLNPHCVGAEDQDEIAPAVRQAKAEGINASGPVPPDSVFRQCIEEQYDCVVAHYHDQGHIPVKTWRFNGNCAVVLGEPSLRVSVGHGTAFDIAGKGIADSLAMKTAILTAVMLSSGLGFPRG